MSVKLAPQNSSWRQSFSLAKWQLAIVASVVAAAWTLASRVLFGEHPLGTVGGFLLVALVSFCSYTDVTRKRIPNWATYTAVLGSLAVNAIASAVMVRTDLTGPAQAAVPGSAAIQVLGAIGLVPSLLGALACFGAMLMIYSVSGSGAGDVKLATAIGAIIGVERGLVAIVWCHILAGIFVLGWLTWEMGLLATITALTQRIGSALLPAWIFPPAREPTIRLTKPVALAPFFAAGTILAVLGVTF